MESLDKLRRSGSISHAAFNRLQAATKSQRTKLAEFDGKSRDEGQHGKGEVPATEINHKTNQRKAIKGRKPANFGERDGKSPSRSHINTFGQAGGKFPAGGKMGTASKRVGVKGGVIQSGPQYGGGGRGVQ
jgi:hypothetical protein